MTDYIETMRSVEQSAYVPPSLLPTEDVASFTVSEIPTSEPKKPGALKVFIMTFISAFLLIFGLIVGGFMVAPVIVALFDSNTPYFPQLPLSADRDDTFFSLASNPGKQPYPPLAEAAVQEQGNWIRIPSIGVNVPIVMSPSLNDADVLATLEYGAALYPNGILPGRLGNTFISAHSTGEPWKGKYRFAFLRINELNTGNVMHVDYEGTRYTYTIISKDIIEPTPDYRVISDRPVPTVTLMACWPLWSTDKRMLIKAELTNVTQLTTPQVS